MAYLTSLLLADQTGADVECIAFFVDAQALDVAVTGNSLRHDAIQLL